MNSPFDASPEDLEQLRISVGDWLDYSRKAVLSFRREDGRGSFLLDNVSDDGEKNGGEREYKLHPTGTARSYLALATADRWRTDQSVKPPEWTNNIENLIDNHPFKIKKRKISDVVLVSDDEDDPLNNFDVAHLADYFFCSDYLIRFYGNKLKLDELFSTKRSLRRRIAGILKENLEGSIPENNSNQLKRVKTGEGGKVLLAEGSTSHFFVTLHTLRALEILDSEYENNDNVIECICKFAKEFCIEQCFYSSRGARHELDIVSLVFATVIYCLYGHPGLIDKDLILACIEALAKAQQANGAWPATHPIIRKEKGRKPWHITSHEVALCLTWLYFQPRVPDAGRGILLGMMEKYFRSWVIPTFTELPNDNDSPPFSGWFDDHTITRGTVMGWATAIVCHFLSNYYWILNDHINRRVIESLNLTATARKYLVDEDAHEYSPRWKADDEKSSLVKELYQAPWPDIPPIAWIGKQKIGKQDVKDLTKRIRWVWADPSLDDSNKSMSERLSQKVVAPIFKSPGERPDKKLCAGMLDGPPGTGKTTLVEVIAGLLRWPLITVPASAIFEAGFDSMEARASEVFRRLNYLSGCVIFFDEFEEFFRDRGPGAPPIHERTIAAFTTSAMLPRLQELHHKGRCLIFLATNGKEKIDSAIRRPGRYDFSLNIGHPTRSRIEEYLDDPTRRTLIELGLQVDDEHYCVHKDDEIRYKNISEYVKDAMKKINCVKIHFSCINTALEEVKYYYELNPEKPAEDRVDVAIRSLEKCLKDIKEAYKGPPNLCDLP